MCLCDNETEKTRDGHEGSEAGEETGGRTGRLSEELIECCPQTDRGTDRHRVIIQLVLWRFNCERLPQIVSQSLLRSLSAGSQPISSSYAPLAAWRRFSRQSPSLIGPRPGAGRPGRAEPSRDKILVKERQRLKALASEDEVLEAPPIRSSVGQMVLQINALEKLCTKLELSGS
ncbi:unnamed protein product [Pleuronectes platessa]|uniref:Uncharacterized protein n=1 Tax=Pleuronectes platessa TaxID=8262 RepID=A0A9N7UC94_PLEPL|nr:unnamed protein product [Pleuronectes platessa]